MEVLMIWWLFEAFSNDTFCSKIFMMLFDETLVWCFLVTFFCWFFFMTLFDVNFFTFLMSSFHPNFHNIFWLHLLITLFDDIILWHFWWQFWCHFWWHFLVAIFDDIFRFQFCLHILYRQFCLTLFGVTFVDSFDDIFIYTLTKIFNYSFLWNFKLRVWFKSETNTFWWQLVNYTFWSLFLIILFHQFFIKPFLLYFFENLDENFRLYFHTFDGIFWLCFLMSLLITLYVDKFLWHFYYIFG